MERNWIVKPTIALLACAALALSACSGADTPAPANSGGQATSTPTAPQGGAAGVSAAALCDYLRGRLPILRDIGSEVGAMANLAGNLSAFYSNQGAVPDGREMDEQTQQTCPDVRTEVLTLAGIDSFAAL